MMSEIKCKLCKANAVHLFDVNTYQLFKCQTCGFIFVYPDPDASTIEQHYAAGYYAEEARYHQINNSEYRLWLRRVQGIENFLPPKSENGRDILDIGCATGIFLKAAQDSGWNVHGVEHSEYGAQQTRMRLGDDEKVYCGNFSEFESQKTFLAVSAWDVIEHVMDPLLFLKKVHSLLQDDGIFAFSTINTSSTNHLLFKQNWRYYTPPEHLCYFNLPNIEQMLAQTGFELLTLRTMFNYQSFLDGVNRWRGLALRPNKFIKSLLYPSKMVSEWFGKGDIVEIWTRKLP